MFIFVAILAVSPMAADHVRTSRKGARLLPLPKERGVWHFVVFGDRTGGPAQGIQVLQQAVTDTNLLDPDLVMTVGDLVEGYNTQPKWLLQTEEFQSVMKALNMPWYPVAGNHDIYWRGPGRPPGGHEKDYEQHFGPLWYWFRHKNSAMVVLYSDEGDAKTDRKGTHLKEHIQMSSEQIEWLRTTLKQTRELEHVFVFLHHPRWITERYRGSNWDAVHTVLAEAGNVSAVFAGHIHRMHYAGIRDGIEYFTLATTGGAKSHEFPEAGWLHHFNVVTVRKDSVQVAAIPVGAVLDPRELPAERHHDIDQLLAGTTPKVVSPVALDAVQVSDGIYEFEVRNPCSRPIVATFTVSGGNSDWVFQPDHAHRQIAPQEIARFQFFYRGTDANQAHPLPALVSSLDYLGEHLRITLPERKSALAATLHAVPAHFFSQENGALFLDGAGSCLRVESSSIPLPDGPLTVEGWIQAESYQGRRPFLAKTESSEYCIFTSDGVASFSV
ncbi:MAG: metallophosphoesterase, partial [Planctomycetota bacterium]